eukprot:scaffold910_cov396-Prasinococcus_capsulatus_cf.AAC.51
MLIGGPDQLERDDVGCGCVEEAMALTSQTQLLYGGPPLGDAALSGGSLEERVQVDVQVVRSPRRATAHAALVRRAAPSPPRVL